MEILHNIAFAIGETGRCAANARGFLQTAVSKVPWRGLIGSSSAIEKYCGIRMGVNCRRYNRIEMTIWLIGIGIGLGVACCIITLVSK
jgi:hypothetical protein